MFISTSRHIYLGIGSHDCMAQPDTTREPSETAEERSETGGTSRRTLLKGAIASGTLALSPALAERVAASGVTSVGFDDQESDGTSVVVDRVNLSEGGFVSVHDGRFVGSHGEVGVGAGSIIGYSEFLEAGTHEDVEVPLFEDEELNLDPYEDRELFDLQYLIALPHADTNGNEEWDFYPGEIDIDTAFQEGDTSSVFPLERTTDGAVIVSEHIDIDEDEEVPLAFDT